MSFDYAAVLEQTVNVLPSDELFRNNGLTAT